MNSQHYILKSFPSPRQLSLQWGNTGLPAFRKVNGHIHTPYSFSSFADMDEIFRMAVEEDVKVLGINDFYVADGHGEFYLHAVSSGIFPLFNIEFIGLIKEAQSEGLRINDPNNPGRIYFSGKGLRYPFSLSEKHDAMLSRVRSETQEQMKAMIEKLNNLLDKTGVGKILDYSTIKDRFAKELVRERHLAKAVRVLCDESYSTDEEKRKFYSLLASGSSFKSAISDIAAVENEIRSKLLKAGGTAFVEEDENSFMSLETIISIITDAGGIPCYPVLLDDASGNYTEFERDPEILWRSLSSRGIGCLELIPGRNRPEKLEQFVRFFDSKGFVITFGTEHNTPDLSPLTVSAGGKLPLSEYLLETGWKGSCIIAAHQYLTAIGLEGFTDKQGTARLHLVDTFFQTGRFVIEHYLKEVTK